MNFQELFAKIYVAHGKKPFQDGAALLELVKETDPSIAERDFVVVDYLSRKKNFDRLLDVRFADQACQDAVVDAICQEIEADYFVPASLTAKCAQGFLSVFQHGSREAMNELEEEYDESLAPTMTMTAIDPAALESEAKDASSYSIDEGIVLTDQLPENEKEQNVEATQTFKKADLEAASAALENMESTRILQPVSLAPEVEEVQPSGMKKVKKGSKVLQDLEPEAAAKVKKQGRVASLVLGILACLMVICTGILVLVLKDMHIL